MSQLAASVTSSAHLSGAVWPYLTNPEFEISGGYLDGLSGISSVAFAPLITAENQTAWETYAVNNQNWVAEGARLRVIHPDHKDPIDGSFQDHEERNLQLGVVLEAPQVPLIPENIYTINEEGEQVPYKASPGEILAPAWQIAPTPGDDPKMVNYQLLADPVVANLVRIMKETRETVLSKALEVENLFDHSYDADEKQEKIVPHSYVAEPVFDNFEPGARMVGFLLALTSWRNMFNNILPEGASGILIVVNGNCGGQFTFELDGPTPVYLGKGDHHDPIFDAYKRSIMVEDYPQGIVEGMCYHEIDVYPSVTFHDSYRTSKPLVYTCTIVIAFLGTAVLFFFYDRLVTRHQQNASADAERTNAIVSSLFPANVRDRLYQDDNDEEGGKKGHGTFMNESGQKNKLTDEENPFSSKPIADLFPEGTLKSTCLPSCSSPLLTVSNLKLLLACLLVVSMSIQLRSCLPILPASPHGRVLANPHRYSNVSVFCINERHDRLPRI